MKVNFEVSAKAARLIGRENIADVDGALSELIKNAYDADASCVYVYFHMPFPDVPTQTSVDAFSTILTPEDYKAILSFYQLKNTELYRREDLTETQKAELQNLLFAYNRIIVADNGEGMTLNTVCSSWMQIATSTKESNVTSKKGRVKTGAKGIGRFALDKLSQKSVMYTKAQNSKTLHWAVDWEQFSSAQLLREVNADVDETEKSLIDVLRDELDAQSLKDVLAYKWDTGTILILSPIREAWSPRLFTKVNTNLKSINPLGSVDKFDVIVENKHYPDYSYRTEAIAIASRDYDYKLHVEYDGDNDLTVEIVRNEFDVRKRHVVFSVGDTRKQFNLSDFWSRKAFWQAPYRKEDYNDGTDVQKLKVDQFIEAQDFDKVRAVGPFTADLYYIMNGKSDFAFVKDVPTRHRKEFLKKFSGVKLYRDNFKVRPYGDEGGLYDWLDLNDRANKSPASISHPSGSWRVLPYQLIGVVKISRVSNGALYDMANREGLTQNESYFYFVNMLQEAISCFEYDRQYIYREYDKWKKECEKQISSAIERVKDDVRKGGIRVKDNTKQGADNEAGNDTSGSQDGGQHFSEQEYREAVDALLKEADREVTAKQTFEILSSAGVILNTFFHEFRGVSTALYTRGSQMRARIDNLLQGQPYSGISFLDPYRKLEDFDRIDQMLAGWLKVVMDAVQEESLGASVLSLWNETNKIANIWGSLLAEKSIKIHINPQIEPTDNEFLFKIAVADLYVIVNNFILNSVYFFEKEEQDSREISVSFTEDESTITMIMENNGPGLDEKYHGHPMQIFEIGESTKPQGTGLGLWLMRDATERNDGQIGVLNKTTGFGIKIEWKK